MVLLKYVNQLNYLGGGRKCWRRPIEATAARPSVFSESKETIGFENLWRKMKWRNLVKPSHR
jgi:hypothetical protein